MKRRPRKPDYKAEARELKSYGIEFGFDLRKKLSPQAKGAITRKRHKLVGYLNPENRFKFVPLKTKEQKRGVRRMVSRDQVTKTGVFVQVPKLKGRKKARVSVNKKGELIIKGGQRRSRFVRIKGDVIRAGSIEELKKKVYAATKGQKVQQVRLHVRGYGSKATYVSLAAFFAYAKDLFEEVADEDEEADRDTDLDDLFSVEIVTKE